VDGTDATHLAICSGRPFHRLEKIPDDNQGALVISLVHENNPLVKGKNIQTGI
jgi:hypothetical protein